MKKLLFLILVSSAMILLSAKESKAQANWVPLDTLSINSGGNVYVYFQEGCMDSTAVLLKFENASSQPVQVTWSLWSGGDTFITEMQPAEIREAQCSAWEILKDFIPPGMTIYDLNPSITIQ